MNLSCGISCCNATRILLIISSLYTWFSEYNLLLAFIILSSMIILVVGLPLWRKLGFTFSLTTVLVGLGFFYVFINLWKTMSKWCGFFFPTLYKSRMNMLISLVYHVYFATVWSCMWDGAQVDRHLNLENILECLPCSCWLIFSILRDYRKNCFC